MAVTTGKMAKFICSRCGSLGKPRRIVKGSIFIEIILWLMLIVPGLIYSIWRHASITMGCQKCGGTMIGTDSPIGRQMLESLAISTM